MQQVEHRGEPDGAGRRRVEAVVHTLAALGCCGETLAEVAHDARNMVTALGLYCDLLEEPGVLATPFAHYGSELRLVAAASRRLVEKLVALDAEISAAPQGGGLRTSHSGDWSAAGLSDPELQQALERSLERNLAGNLDRTLEGKLDFNSNFSSDSRRNSNPDPASAPGFSLLTGDPASEPASAAGFGPALGRGLRWESIFAEPIRNLAAELAANRNLLAALAGPGIAVTVETDGGGHGVRLTAEDLTRMLVNLIKNAAEAMPGGGRIHIALSERPVAAGATPSAPGRLVLAVDDTGPGIAESKLEKIFESGFTTHARSAAPGGWPSAHRGLGLAITRSIVEAAGGRIVASNRIDSAWASGAIPGPVSESGSGSSSAATSGSTSGVSGARFEIELPVRAT